MELLNTLLAAFPLLLILILMVGFRWNGARAGIAGWITALIIAAFRFGAGPEMLFWAQVRGIFQALYVLYIIWGALLFFRVTEADGTLDTMSAALKQLSPGRALQALLLAWVFASFLQGVGGFGVPVAVVAPILVGLGFPALEAVIMPSLGHAWAISFGSLGSSFYALTAATGLAGATIAPWMALALGLVCFQVGFAVLWIAGGKEALKENLLPMLSMAIVMSVTQWLAALAGLWSIAAMLGSLAGLIVGGLWALSRQTTSKRSAVSRKQFLTSLVPYAILLSIIFAEKFIQPLQNLLGIITVQVNVPQTASALGHIVPASNARSISILGHPGALLIYAGLLTWLLAKRQGRLDQGSEQRIIKGMVRSGIKSTLGILTMVGMAATMDSTGMVAHLSHAMADLAGGLFPLVSPFIGALGAFMTGSNTNSNVLFGAFQKQVAQALGYTVPMILGIHNAGAAIGSVFSPAKIIVGCSTVGLSGAEGDVLRRITRYSVLIIGSLAVLALILANWL